MATVSYFEEDIVDQNGAKNVSVELGSSSNSIYLKVGNQSVLMDRKMAKKFVEAAGEVGRYYGFVD